MLKSKDSNIGWKRAWPRYDDRDAATPVLESGVCASRRDGDSRRRRPFAFVACHSGRCRRFARQAAAGWRSDPGNRPQGKPDTARCRSPRRRAARGIRQGRPCQWPQRNRDHRRGQRRSSACRHLAYRRPGGLLAAGRRTGCLRQHPPGAWAGCHHRTAPPSQGDRAGRHLRTAELFADPDAAEGARSPGFAATAGHRQRRGESDRVCR